jgi:hypothetical protein
MSTRDGDKRRTTAETSIAEEDTSDTIGRGQVWETNGDGRIREGSGEKCESVVL